MMPTRPTHRVLSPYQLSHVFCNVLNDHGLHICISYICFRPSVPVSPHVDISAGHLLLVSVYSCMALYGALYTVELLCLWMLLGPAIFHSVFYEVTFQYEV